MAKVSVVVPVYNAEDTIEKLNKSLTSQTLQDIEIIYVDDCSTDNSFMYLSEYANVDKRIKVLKNKDNIGTMLARKSGVKEASGEYIMFADNDDWYETNACEKLYSRIKESNTDILLYGVRAVKTAEHVSDEYIERYSRKSLSIKSEEHEGENCLLIKNSIDRLWNKIIRTSICRKAFDSADEIRLTHAEDTYACWLIHYYAKSLTTTKNIYYNHTVGDGLTTRILRLDNFKDWCKCRERCTKHLEEFLLSNNANNKVMDKYYASKGIWVKYCVETWKDKIAIADAEKGLQILYESFGVDATLDTIKNGWTDAEDKLTRCRKELNEIKEEQKRFKKSKMGRIYNKLIEKK